MDTGASLLPSAPPADTPRIARGAGLPVNPAISVVVMAINGDSRVAGAVASLRAEDIAAEIIVVNTGLGSVKQVLAHELDHLVLVEADALRWPGGTRNLGVAESTAGIVAFLAADCLATPGWIAARLAAHRAGALAVASALRPAPGPAGTVPIASWASYALLHVRRAPEYPAAETLRYSVSYHRSLFERHGAFREDVLIGEDSEFNARVTAETPIAWAPEIVTLHAYPASFAAAWRDAFDRGRQLYHWSRGRTRSPLLTSVRRALGNWSLGRGLAAYTQGDVRTALRRAAPLIALLAAAYAWGGAVAAWRDRGGPPR